MFGFDKPKPPYVPDVPDVLASYKCRMCGETFERDPDGMEFSIRSKTWTMLGHTAHSTVAHGCSSHQQGAADFIGMKLRVPNEKVS